MAHLGEGRKKADADEEAEHETGQSEEFHPNDRYSRMGLSESNREEIGRLCKRVLDCGRIQYLNSAFPTLSVQLKHYVSPEVSLGSLDVRTICISSSSSSLSSFSSPSVFGLTIVIALQR